MNFTNAFESNPGTSVDECSTNFKQNDDSMRIQTSEASSRVMKARISTSSNKKNSKKHAKKGKLSRKRKEPDHPRTSETKVQKVSRKRNGSSLASEPSDDGSLPNLSRGEDSLEIQEDEVSNNMNITNNTADSDGKNTKKPTKEGKPLSKRKKPDYQPTLETDVKKTSRKQNLASVATIPSAVECPSNLNIDNETMEIQAVEVLSNNINNPESSDDKKTKKQAKDGKRPYKRKKPDILPMLQVVKAMKDKRKQSEASVEAATSIFECPTIKTDENSIRNPGDEDSNKKKTTNNPASFYEKSTKKQPKNRKISPKRKNTDQLVILQNMTANNDSVDQNAEFTEVGASAVESPFYLKTDVKTMKIEPNKVLNKIKTTNKPSKSHLKNSNVPTDHKKLLLNRRMPYYPPTSQMVMEAIKALRKRNGASVDAILEYMQGQYRVNAKLIRRYVTRYMKSAVQKGIIEQFHSSGNDERFKIKTVGKVAKGRKK